MKTLWEVRGEEGIKDLAMDILLEMVGNKLHPDDDYAFSKFVLNMAHPEKALELKTKYPKTFNTIHTILLDNKDKPVDKIPDYFEIEEVVKGSFYNEHANVR